MKTRCNSKGGISMIGHRQTYLTPADFVPIALLVACLCLAVGPSNAARAAGDENTLSITILLPRDNSGIAILPHGEGFKVGITNHSDRPIKIWEEMSLPGNRTLTFRAKKDGREAPIIQKSDAVPDGWADEFRYVPRVRSIPPKSGEIRKINFSEYIGSFISSGRAWLNVPGPNTGEKVELKAVFEIVASDEAKTNGLWTGRIESAPLTVQVVDPKLDTPHLYLMHGFPEQALAMMKRDAFWIGTKDDQQCTPLHRAASFGPKEIVVWLVEHGADIDARCYNQFTPLYFAASDGHLDILKYLIEKGASVEAPSNGGTPIQAAAQRKHLEIVKTLLAAGAFYDLRTAMSLSDEDRVKELLKEDPGRALGGWQLFSACQEGQVGIVALLLQNGADPNQSSDTWKDSPLLWALEHPAVVKMLLEKGADAKIRVNVRFVAFGSTLLHEAARQGLLESARLLLDHGAEIDAILVDDFMSRPVKETVFTPLHSAASGGHPKLVELLLGRKADVKRLTSNGENALQLAAAQIRFVEDTETREENRRYTEVIKMLAARGLEIDLFAAIALGDEERIAALLKAKPKSINETNSDGCLPLQRAVAMNQPPMVEKLLAAGANVNGVGWHGWTPLIEAARCGRPKMVRLLLDRGANPDMKGERNDTALSVAERVMPDSHRKQDYEEVVKLLRGRVR